MADLIPFSFPSLIRVMHDGLRTRNAIFDVPKSKFFRTPDGLDFSIRFHDLRAATPFGPAAGPHAQMAQNIVMSWLVGSRVIELKTVQVNDALAIPRPCIDMPNLGFNVEWSQELKVPQSLYEYVKGSMLVDMLIHQSSLHGGDLLVLSAGDDDTVYDMSVGYDLAGIRTDKVTAEFINKMLDATAIVDELRAQIPAEYAHLRDLPYRTRISDSVTLSTFHGCPPDEVEKIGEYLIDDLGVRTIIKLNPTLLGPARLRHLLHEHLGYTELVVPDSAFTDDMQYEQAVGILTRLRDRAAKRGVGFGAKFTNTLIVQNHRDVFPETEKVMYLSGDPLHVLSSNLAADFRERFRDTIQISFSAGIKAQNFADAVALGLTPITSSTDLLKKGGYARAWKYFRGLEKAMKAAGATDVDTFIIARSGRDVGTWQAGDVHELTQAKVDNALAYRERLNTTPEYAAAKLDKVPAKPGTQLTTFDCLTCDLCIPVCPNDANFSYTLDVATVPVTKATMRDGAWRLEQTGELAANKKHQIGNFADFCNECGNCDTFCPDLGGPYILKPRFFGSLAQWQEWSGHDGFYVDAAAGRLYGRFDGSEYVATQLGDRRFDLVHGELALTVDLDAATVTGAGADGVEVDLTYLHLLATMGRAIAAMPAHYLNCS